MTVPTPLMFSDLLLAAVLTGIVSGSGSYWTKSSRLFVKCNEVPESNIQQLLNFSVHPLHCLTCSLLNLSHLEVRRWRCLLKLLLGAIVIDLFNDLIESVVTILDLLYPSSWLQVFWRDKSLVTELANRGWWETYSPRSLLTSSSGSEPKKTSLSSYLQCDHFWVKNPGWTQEVQH